MQPSGRAVRTLAPALQAVTETRGVVVVVTGFGVPHAHVHLMPANTREQALGGERVQIAPDELASLAARVRAEIARAEPDAPSPAEAGDVPTGDLSTPG